MPSAGQSSLFIEWGPGDTELLELQYNPTEIALEQNVHVAELAIPALSSPLQQFVRGEAETLRLELFFDTSDQGIALDAVSVVTLTDPIYALARIVPDQHAPPIVTFIWGPDFPGNELPPELGSQGRNSFTGVVTSIKQTFTLWSSGGLPLRAKLSLALREYAALQDQLTALNLASPSASTYACVLCPE